MRYFPIYIFTLLLISCEKDIEIEYHQAEPVYVVEASVSNKGTEVRVSQTNAMNDNSSASNVSQAKVTVSNTDGQKWTIPFTGNGIYKSSLKGTPGTTYQIDVDVDNEHFSSTSTMQKMPMQNSCTLIRKKILNENFIFLDLRLQDIPNEENWYFMHIYRNNIGYRWAIMRDSKSPNKELQQLFTLYREGSNDSDVLNEGDLLHLVVRAIDKKSYDYLYSLQIMDNTGTNPIKNFSGGCMGYFSAFSEITADMFFHAADIEDEKKE